MPAPDASPLAEPLHRQALQLLRLLRQEDLASGVSAARLSALSVLVFGGPMTLTALAAAEQVSAPTMSRLVDALEREGWLRRRPDRDDARAARLEATPRAVGLLHEGRARRLARLSGGLARLTAADRRSIADALGPLDRLVASLRTAPSPKTKAAPRTARRRLD